MLFKGEEIAHDVPFDKCFSFSSRILYADDTNPSNSSSLE